MKGEKYLITGMTGFSAPHLAKILLKDGYEVHGLIRGGEERKSDLLNVLSTNELDAVLFHHGDIRDEAIISNIFKHNEFDGVFHLGAQTNMPEARKNPYETFKTNVNGTINIVDSIIKYQAKCALMFCSSGAVYGRAKGDITETTPISPVEPYGVSKAAAELYVMERAKSLNLPFFVARAFSHTGPRRGKNFSISWDAYHLAMIKNGKNPNGDISPVNDYDMPLDIMKALPIGNLSTERIVMDVRDCVEAYKGLMDNVDESMVGEAYNVCGNKNNLFKMEKFTDILIDVSGLEGIVKVKDKRVFRPIAGDVQSPIVSTEKIVEKIGWQSETPIETSLTDLFNYWVDRTK